MKTVTRKDLVKDHRGFSLVGAMFVMLAMSAVGLSMSSSLSNFAVTSAADLDSLNSFNTAEGVLQAIISEDFMSDVDFSDNVSPTGNVGSDTPIEFGNAQAWIEYSSQSVYSTTITVTAQEGNSTRSVQQTVSHAIPLGKPVFSGGDITIDGNQPYITVFGFKVYLPSGYMHADVGAGGTISHPSHFIINGSTTSNMQVVLPSPNVASLVYITDTTHEGDLTIGPGLYEDNVHVTGDVTVADNTIITGNVVSDGDITVTGDVATFGTLAAGGNIDGTLTENAIFWAQDGDSGETLPALMAEGNINLNTDGLGAAAVGLVYAGGDISYYADAPSGDWGEAMILTGANIAGGNLDIYNEMGFVLIWGDDSLITALAQPGTVKLKDWHEV